MNIKEIGAYLRVRGEMDEETERLIRTVYPIAEGTLHRISDRRFGLVRTKEGLRLSGTDVTLRGELAARHFVECDEVYVVLLTMGMESERNIKSTYALSPTKGLVLDACYSEAIERRLDAYEEEKRKDGDRLTSRISCGYGDLPLETQGPILRLLSPEKIGVYQNESFMLVPNKSVVAIVGIKR